MAEECGQSYVIVKPALKIQEEEAPQYDNTLICFGAFHIILAYFSGIGFVLAKSSGPEVLIETGVLALGSCNGFLSGRHYNQCKRLHPLLANSMHILHFRTFLAHHGPLPVEFMAQLKTLHEDPSPETIQEFNKSPSYATVMQEYDDFTEATHSGFHGSTAAYWIKYIDQLFRRAVRTHNLDLFMYCLGEICDI